MARSTLWTVLPVGILVAAGLAPLVAQAALPAVQGGGRFTLRAVPGPGYHASMTLLLFFKVPLYPQIACWLEAENGQFVQTVYVTHRGGRKDFYSAPSGGRPEALPVWYHRAGERGTLDAVSSATSTSNVSASRPADAALPPGSYFVFLEVNRSYDYNQTWTRANSGVNGQPSVIYRAVLDVKPGTASRAELQPFGAGSVDGSDGEIRPGLDGITTALTSPNVLVVNPALPVHSLADLAALAKSQPLTFASAGPGTAQHLEGEMLKQSLGLEMTHVPYKGALPALNDVMGGHVAMMFTPIANALSMIQAGKVRAIGVAASTRIEALPDVPPLAEIGAPGFEAGGWFMLVAPAATPRAIIDRLHAESRAILAEPELRAQFVRQGLIPVDTPSPDELKAFVREQIAYWDRTLHRIGLAGME